LTLFPPNPNPYPNPYHLIVPLLSFQRVVRLWGKETINSSPINSILKTPAKLASVINSGAVNEEDSETEREIEEEQRKLREAEKKIRAEEEENERRERSREVSKPNPNLSPFQSLIFKPSHW
jgi:hypothetical protein